VIVWLLARLRSLYHNLEAQVRQRTAALTDEMVERERLERELLEVSEREQRRIGQDLHDGLCQHLTGATLAGQVLEGKLAALNLPESGRCHKMVELMEEGIDLSRKLAKGLYPVEMAADGLMLALEEYAATTSELFKVACRFECDSPVLIHDTATAGHLYRIAQEAVGNAIKHGKARNILIRLEVGEESTGLSIKDDGTGLPESLPKNRGIGLRIMAHRSAMIGGTFAARRDEAGGTLLTCAFRAESESSKTAVNKPKIKIFLVDDHPLVREWLTNLIHQQPDLVVCGESEEAPHALQEISRPSPTWPSWTSHSSTARASS